jgi:hypothetical protein
LRVAVRSGDFSAFTTGGFFLLSGDFERVR